MKNEVKFVPPYCAQGDLNIFSCKDIPKNLIEQKKEGGQYILAHSETGHHHVIDGNVARVVNKNEFISYMEVKEEAKIFHLRKFDTHKTIVLPPGNYRLTRQREYVPYQPKAFRPATD